MLTQLTYAGLIDDTWGIKDGVSMIPGSVVPGRHQFGENKDDVIKVPLTEEDAIYASIRDLPIKDCDAVVNPDPFKKMTEKTPQKKSGGKRGDSSDLFVSILSGESEEEDKNTVLLHPAHHPQPANTELYVYRYRSM